MGAGIVVRAAAADPRFRALVLESPYLDLEEAIVVMLRRLRLPAPRWLARMIAARAEALTGVSLTRPRPIDTAPLVHAPTLIVHGADDSLVLLADARRLADAFRHPAALIEVPGARHANVVDVGGADLLDCIAGFLDESVRANQSATVERPTYREASPRSDTPQRPPATFDPHTQGLKG
jgi:alpha-beta hydrolase superfamily lysophospholipase